MKLHNYITLLLLVVIITAISCNKTKNVGPSPGPKYRVTHLIDTLKDLPPGFDSQTVVYDYQITYTNNRMASMTVNQTIIYVGDTTFSSYMKTFVYHDSSYVIHYPSTSFLVDSVILNNAYLITSVQGLNTSFFTYNNNFQLVNFFQSGGIFFSSSRCIWNADGNIATIISDADTSTLTYYTDKPDRLGDILGLSNFTLYGNPIFHTRNLTKSIINRFNTINADYTFDQNNNVSKAISVQTNYDVNHTINEVITNSYYFTYESY